MPKTGLRRGRTGNTIPASLWQRVRGGVGGFLIVLEQDELIGVEIRYFQLNLLLGKELGDQVGGNFHLAPATVEALKVYLLGLEILGGNAKGIALDAGIDVLGDEDGLLALLDQIVSDGDDAIVGGIGGQARAELDLMRQDDANPAVGLGDVDALGEMAEAAEVVEVADDGAGIAAKIVGGGLEPVEFLDHIEGDHDLIISQEEDRVGVVQQDIGVDDKVLRFFVHVPIPFDGGFESLADE